MTCFVLNRVAGNTGPDIYTVLENTDLATLLGLSVTLRREDGAVVTHDAVIDDAAAGEFHIVWDATDLVEGDHRLEYVITDAGGNVRRTPSEQTIMVKVRAAL